MLAEGKGDGPSVDGVVFEGGKAGQDTDWPTENMYL